MVCVLKIFLPLLCLILMLSTTFELAGQPLKKPGVWKPLFNGKTLDGWTGYHPDRPIDGWSAKGGTIIFSGKSDGGGGNDLMTTSQYGDFILTFDWKVASGSNSGVIYRAQPGHRSSFFSGPEYQILDDAKHPDGKSSLTSAGSLYAMYPAQQDAFNKPGKWNRAYIIAKGNQVEHWVNGVKLFEAEINSDDWKKRLSQSRHKSVDGWAQNSSGHIVLQDHGNQVAFRNLWIRPLDTGAQLPHDPETPRLAQEDRSHAKSEWHNLLDEDLSQWEIFLGVPAVDIAVDWPHKNNNLWKGKPLGFNEDTLGVYNILNQGGEPVLYITGEIFGGLTTRVEYENFHWSLEVKWGEKKWPPREHIQRDSGLLYHCVGEHGAYANVWMQSLEMQIQERDFGDFYGLGGARASIPVKPLETADPKERRIFSPNGDYLFFDHDAPFGNRVRRSSDHELKNGQWNKVDIYCIGDTAIHVVNGQPVLTLKDAKQKMPDGHYAPLMRGKFQIQSEGAEIYYRRVRVRVISEYPEFLAK